MSSVSRDGDFTIIRIPNKDVLALRICLHPCPCIEPKSNSTLDYARRLDLALAKAGSK